MHQPLYFKFVIFTKRSVMKLSFLWLFSLIILSRISYSQTFDWVQNITQGGNNHVWDMVSMPDGSIVATGRVKFDVIFGRGPSSQPAVGFGETDTYLIKFNPDSTLAWHRRMGGVNPDWGRGITIDQEENIYLTGDFANIAVFDNDTIYGYDNGSTNVNSMARSGYVAKYNTNGDLIWVNKFQGTGHCRGYAIEVDASGNSYLTGMITGITDFDGQITGEGTTYQYAFIAKYDPDGNCVWAKYVDGQYGSLGHEIEVMSANQILVTGYYRGTLNYYGNIYSGTGASWGDMFTMMVDSSGNLVWNKTANGPYQIQGNGITFDPDHNVYVSGTFTQNTTFDGNVYTYTGIGATATDINANADGFVAKYTEQGSLVWVETFENDQMVELEKILVDKDQLFITGHMSDTLIIDNDTVIVPNNTSTGLLLCIDTSGAHKWTKIIPGAGTSPLNYIRSVAVDQYRNIYISGGFEETATWDSQSIVANTGYDGFIAKVFPPLEPFIVGDTSICLSDTLLLTASANGSPFTNNWIIQNGAVINSTTDSLVISPNTLGVDTIRYIVTNGYETDTALFLVYVNSGLIVNLGADEVFCDGDSVVLIAGNSDFYYDWGSGFSLGDSSITVYTGGEYSVQVMNSIGCSGADTLSLILSDCLGISENQEDVFRVMPNPFSNILNVRFVNNGFEDPIVLSVYSLTGEIVFEIENPAENESIDFSDLNSGIYFCMITSSTRNTNLVKVVKLD